MREGRALGRLSTLDLERFLSRCPPRLHPEEYARQTGRADHAVLATTYRALTDVSFCRSVLAIGVVARGRVISFGR